MRPIPLIALTCCACAAILTCSPWHGPTSKAYLEASVPYVGADIPVQAGYDGSGITIGVIDTGIDAKHADLRDVTVRNFFDGPAEDSSGHGTGVAGVIAASGGMRGVAPGASIISYKVSDDGESVPSDLITAAINAAINDGVDIINISLGVNRTNQKIDEAVSAAVKAGITVVVAAGNDGPDSATIGSPGLSPSAITVGASYNNVTSSLVATLKVAGESFEVAPMIGSPQTDMPLEAHLTFGGYSTINDYEDGDFAGMIILAERGGREKPVYFSEKESAAAAAGAIALIIYNNEPGIYLGELYHENNTKKYEPSIPVVSISRSDGFELYNMTGQRAALDIFYDPDTVAHFSSRGPVSPFYTKPDLVAPGVHVNTTLNGGGYNVTGGTSFAAPHVAGAAALLLQKEPDLLPSEVKSILLTTSDPIGAPSEAAGSGRLNVTRAFGAESIISPPSLVFLLSPLHDTDEAIITLDGQGNYSVSVNQLEGATLEYELFDNHITVRASLDGAEPGVYGGQILIDDGRTIYRVPVIIHHTEGTILASPGDGAIDIKVAEPADWTYAGLTLIDSQSGSGRLVSLVPGERGGIAIQENGTYWIEARIEGTEGESLALAAVMVDGASRGFAGNLPERQVFIVSVFAASLALAAVIFRADSGRRRGSLVRHRRTF